MTSILSCAIIKAILPVLINNMSEDYRPESVIGRYIKRAAWHASSQYGRDFLDYTKGGKKNILGCSPSSPKESLIKRAEQSAGQSHLYEAAGFLDLVVNPTPTLHRPNPTRDDYIKAGSIVGELLARLNQRDRKQLWKIAAAGFEANPGAFADLSRKLDRREMNLRNISTATGQLIRQELIEQGIIKPAR